MLTGEPGEPGEHNIIFSVLAFIDLVCWLTGTVEVQISEKFWHSDTSVNYIGNKITVHIYWQVLVLGCTQSKTGIHCILIFALLCQEMHINSVYKVFKHDTFFSATEIYVEVFFKKS